MLLLLAKASKQSEEDHNKEKGRLKEAFEQLLSVLREKYQQLKDELDLYERQNQAQLLKKQQHLED